MIDTLTWRTEGTGYGFTRADVLAMELGEVLFYFRQARRHHNEISEARKGAAQARDGVEVETHGWAKPEDAGEDEENESVSVESLLDD